MASETELGLPPVGDDQGDHVDSLIQQLKSEALVPLKEDLAEWLNNVIGPIGINTDNFMDVLSDGVCLCKLARLIENKGRQEIPQHSGKLSQMRQTSLPPKPIRFREKVERGSWLARDNTTNFINWCRQFGVKEECLFETEGLVLQRDHRNVVLCLLDLARLAIQYGIEPPTIVRMETEIDMEENQSRNGARSSSCVDLVDSALVVLQPSSKSGSASSPRVDHRHSPDPILVQPSRSGSASSPHVDISDPVKSRPTCVKETGDTRRPQSGASSKNMERRKSANLSAGSVSKLDQAVSKAVGCCCCSACYEVKRLSEGRYRLGGKVVFIRLLKERHLMVRVGGGWDTLENYLVQHDPCKIKEYKARGSGSLAEVIDRFKVSC